MGVRQRCNLRTVLFRHRHRRHAQARKFASAGRGRGNTFIGDGVNLLGDRGRPLTASSTTPGSLDLQCSHGVVFNSSPHLLAGTGDWTHGGTQTAALGKLGAVLTMAASWVMLDEAISAYQVAGMALVLFGVSRLKPAQSEG